MSISVQKGQTV